MKIKKKTEGYETIKKYMQVLKTYYNRDNKVKQITLVWACTESGRKQNSQKGIIYEFGNNKIEIEIDCKMR